MRDLYPPIEPFRTVRLDRDGGHAVYVEECGRPDGVPVLFLHGGPGSGCAPAHRRFFDPAHYRIVLVDQRGSGRSTPLGETAANSTSDLVGDLEAVRAALGVERWLVFGGSWGATLALAYALVHPERLLGLVLRGVFLGRDADLDWFFGADGAARLLPEDWRAFRALGGSDDWAGLIDSYHRLVHGRDTRAAHRAAWHWSAWGDRVVTWSQPASVGPERGCSAKSAGRRLAKVRIETHYARNRYFLDRGPLLERVGALAGMPVTLIQGQRDLVCPPDAAWRLQRAIPGSRLQLLPDAGHLIWEPAMVDALVSETDRLRRTLG